MRSDFPKLLCERQRIGHIRTNVELRLDRHKFKQTGVWDEGDDEDDDVDPVSYSGRRAKTRPKDGRKELNENLSPLRRFLEKSVGRPWADVYSELKEANPKGPVGSHVFEHLFDYVAVNVADGQTHTRYSGVQPLAKSQFRYYVDPQGIMRHNVRPSKLEYLNHLVKKDEDTILIETNAYRWFYRANGRWWHIRTSAWDGNPPSDNFIKSISNRAIESLPGTYSIAYTWASAQPAGVKQIKAINRLLGR